MPSNATILLFIFILAQHVSVLQDHHQVIYSCNEIVELCNGSVLLDSYFVFLLWCRFIFPYLRAVFVIGVFCSFRSLWSLFLLFAFCFSYCCVLLLCFLSFSVVSLILLIKLVRTAEKHRSSAAVRLFLSGPNRKHNFSVVCGPLPSYNHRVICRGRCLATGVNSAIS
jgi:hypothetical protein